MENVCSIIYKPFFKFCSYFFSQCLHTVMPKFVALFEEFENCVLVDPFIANGVESFDEIIDRRFGSDMPSGV